MVATSASGSPAPRSRTQFNIHEDNDDGMGTPTTTRQAVSSSTDADFTSLSPLQSSKHAIKHSEDPIPLASSKLGNAQVQAGDASAAAYKVDLILRSSLKSHCANRHRSPSLISLLLQPKVTPREIPWTLY